MSKRGYVLDLQILFIFRSFDLKQKALPLCSQGNKSVLSPERQRAQVGIPCPTLTSGENNVSNHSKQTSLYPITTLKSHLRHKSATL